MYVRIDAGGMIDVQCLNAWKKKLDSNMNQKVQNPNSVNSTQK